MDMALAQKVVEASCGQQQFVLGALWSEVEKRVGEDYANDLVRRAFEAFETKREIAKRAIGAFTIPEGADPNEMLAEERKR